MSVTIGGTFSGLNVSSIIQAIIAADSIPITNLQKTDTTLTNNSSDLGSLGSSLGNLSVQLQDLNSSTLFTSQTATASNATGTITVQNVISTYNDSLKGVLVNEQNQNTWFEADRQANQFQAAAVAA